MKIILQNEICINLKIKTVKIIKLFFIKLKKADGPVDSELEVINKWNKTRTELKILPASTLKLNNPNKDSDCFRFSPKSIEGLNYQSKSNDVYKLAIKFNFSFFSNQLKQFFGRSLLTGAYYLEKEKQGNSFQFEQPYPFQLFFHSKLDKTSGTQLLFEAYILEIGNHDVIKNTQSYGVGEINILSLLKEPQNISLKNTSMRQYVSTYSTDQRVAQTGLRLSFILEQFNPLNSIKNLFPDGVLISSKDIIPGLAYEWNDEKFQENPMQKAEKAAEQMMESLPTFKVYLTNVKITFRESVEKELISQKKEDPKKEDPKKEEFKREIQTKVNFKEKKLICGFHNGWEFVNRGGSQNRVNLKQGPRQLIKDEEDHEVNLISLEYSGMHEIDNVFESNSSVIVLQLEYEIEVISQTRQISTRVISWIPINISGKFAKQKEILISDVMLHGPGKSVDGQRMISLPYKDEFNVQISANFKTVPQAANKISLYEELQNTQNLQNQQKETQFQQNMTKQQQEKYQHQIKQQELKKQQQIKQKQQPQNKQDDAQINQQRILEELNTQIMQKRQHEFMGGNAQYNPTQEYQMISWEPRNEQEKHLRDLQNQAQQMRDQIQQYQKERDYAQLGLTQEYRLMREEIVKTRNSQNASASSFYKQKSSPKKQSPFKNKSNNYDYDDDDDDDDDDDEVDENMEYFEGRELKSIPNDSKVTFQGKNKSLIIHQSQTSLGKKELTRYDLDELMMNHVNGLLDDIPIMNTQDQNYGEDALIENELKDNLKASIIVFKIKSFKPNQYSGLPKRMFLTLNFFDFPKYQTDSFSYEHKEDRSELMRMIEMQTPIDLFREAFLKGEDDKFLSFKFEIDPSKSKYSDLHKDFVTYLIKKQLHVDIWDADTLMLYGSFKVPLNQVRRNGLKRQAYTTVNLLTQIKLFIQNILQQKDLEIVNINLIDSRKRGSRGSIQISIDNIGKEEVNPNKRREKEEQENMRLQQNESFSKWQNQPSKKSKVISDRSVQIPQNYLKNQKINAAANMGRIDDYSKEAGVKSEEQARKMEKVKRFKNVVLNKANQIFGGEDEVKMLQKMNLDKEIEKIKDLAQHRIDKVGEIKQNISNFNLLLFLSNQLG